MTAVWPVATDAAAIAEVERTAPAIPTARRDHLRPTLRTRRSHASPPSRFPAAPNANGRAEMESSSSRNPCPFTRKVWSQVWKKLIE